MCYTWALEVNGGAEVPRAVSRDCLVALALQEGQEPLTSFDNAALRVLGLNTQWYY